MLHQLEIENFYSIRDPQIIDLRVSGRVPTEPGRLAPLWQGADERAPKVVALFGPNASGKSNVLKALAFIAWFVKDSFAAPRGSLLPFDRFNDAEMFEAPTRLAVHLGGIEDATKAGDSNALQCRYAYEVTISGGPGQSVLNEGLYYWPSTASRKVKLFERDASGTVTAAKAFGLAGFRPALEKVLRSNASVISTLSQLDHGFSKMIWNAAASVVSNIFIERSDISEDHVIRHYAANPKLVEGFNNVIERIDLGIQSMQLHQGAQGPLAFFTHNGLRAPMPIMYESHGTRQFIKLYPLILHALETGGIAVIDELDTAIHPLILPEILRWFYDPARNPNNGQLWMSCHSAPLLEELVKEEVLFCDKDSRGRTEIYSLRDIQSVRRSENYYKKYLGGAFGAIPQIG